MTMVCLSDLVYLNRLNISGVDSFFRNVLHHCGASRSVTLAFFHACYCCVLWYEVSISTSRNIADITIWFFKIQIEKKYHYYLEQYMPHPAPLPMVFLPLPVFFFVFMLLPTFLRYAAFTYSNQSQAQSLNWFQTTLMTQVVKQKA